MKKISILICLIISATFMSAQTSIGIFQNQFDVGNTPAGSAKYNDQTQEYTIEGSGNNIWFNHDGFHYVCTQLKGDFILRCNASFIGKGVEAHRNKLEVLIHGQEVVEVGNFGHKSKACLGFFGLLS